jgi:hypothetical protein
MSMDTSHRDAETLRLIRAFKAIADDQIRQAIIEIVRTAAREVSVEQDAIEVLNAHIDRRKPN